MRKRNCKKAAAALMAAALSTALLAGCGSTAPVDSTPESVAVSEAAPAQSTEEGDADEMAARNCADLIDAIYVQTRTEDTDAQCEAAKAAWDALTDTQKEMVEGENADPDMTAMAIQALAPYYENAQVKAAVDAALTFLAGAQNDDATFSEIPGTDASAESTAQVIVALTALGIDPTADSRFNKNDLTVLDALASFYVTGGGFRHTAGGDRDGMATEQGYYALAAYYRLLAQKTSLYDMSDVTVTVTPDQPVTPAKPEKPDTPRTGDESLLVLWMGAAALSGAAVLLMQRKKKRA